VVTKRGESDGCVWCKGRVETGAEEHRRLRWAVAQVEK